MIDTHSHILHGLDDGAGDIDEAVAMARLAEADGIRTIVATPHAWHPMFHTTTEDRDSRLQDLQDRLTREDINITLVPGAECYLRASFLDDLKAQPNYLMGFRKRWVLLEWPDDRALSMIRPFLFEAQVAGIDLLLAHAERHPDALSSVRCLTELVEAGLRIQVTSSSLTRTFGWRVQRLAKRLVRDGLVYVIASDSHDLSTRPPLLAEALDVARRVIGPKADALVGSNAARIIGECCAPGRG